MHVHSGAPDSWFLNMVAPPLRDLGRFFARGDGAWHAVGRSATQAAVRDCQPQVKAMEPSVDYPALQSEAADEKTRKLAFDAGGGTGMGSYGPGLGPKLFKSTYDITPVLWQPPCGTYSAARFLAMNSSDPGPIPLRDIDNPDGIPLSQLPAEYHRELLAAQLLVRTGSPTCYSSPTHTACTG